MQSAYDRLSVELGYQVFSSDEDSDDDSLVQSQQQISSHGQQHRLPDTFALL